MKAEIGTARLTTVTRTRVLTLDTEENGKWVTANGDPLVGMAILRRHQSLSKISEPGYFGKTEDGNLGAVQKS